jgi:uridine kinase
MESETCAVGCNAQSARIDSRAARVIGIAGSPFSEKTLFAEVICDRLANEQKTVVPIIQADWDTTKTRLAVDAIKSTGKGLTSRGDEVRIDFIVVVGSTIFLDDELLAMIDLCVYIDSSANTQARGLTNEAIVRERTIADRANMIIWNNRISDHSTEDECIPIWKNPVWNHPDIDKVVRNALDDFG